MPASHRAHLPITCRAASDAVYLVCNELSGDSSIIALRPWDGATAWALSTSSLARALTPVRAAAAIDGAFVYADTGSNVTALSAADGALMWRVDVAALVPSTVNGASVTHLELVAGDLLLVRWVRPAGCLQAVWDLCLCDARSHDTLSARPSPRLCPVRCCREYSAAQTFSSGPSSYLALQLNATGGSPELLWAAGSGGGRDRLPPGTSEASPIVPPAVLADEDLFFYWSATAPPPPPTAPPPPAPTVLIASGVSAAAGGGISTVRLATGTPRVLLADIAAAGAANATAPAVAPAPASATSAAPGPAPAVVAANTTQAADPVPPPVVPAESEGVGQVAPEGFVSQPV